MTPLLLLSVALAAEPAKLVGTSMSGGASPLTITVTEVDEHKRLIEVHWDEFDKVTLEQVTPTTTACTSTELDGGRAFVKDVDRCIIARLPDRHPTYDYEDKTKVRCVFGSTDNEPAAACKLQYCGWFELKAR